MKLKSVLSSMWRFASQFAMKLLGARTHDRLYTCYQLFVLGGWAQIRRYKKTAINPDRFKLAVCAIIKNEAPYLDEWIRFHRAVGVQKFYFYLNDCTDDSARILKPYEDCGLVDCVVFNGDSQQVPAYQDCLDRHHADADWLAFIDLDEFLVPFKASSVHEILDTLPGECDQVLAKWLFFGSSGCSKASPEWVIERFTRRGNFSGLDYQTKAIVRPRSVYKLYVHRHLVVGSTVKLDESQLRVHHYFCKSWEEYVLRAPRGDVYWGKENGALKYSRKLFDERDLNDIEDRAALRFLSQMRLQN